MTEQILTRYKLINSNEESFREPDKVLLKSADDLILFGKDLIKDVLIDNSQVQLVVKSWKDAPKLSQLYEQVCSIKCYPVFHNIKLVLDESETSNELIASSLLCEQLTSKWQHQQFESLFESIKVNIKQSVRAGDDSYEASAIPRLNTSSWPFIKALTKIDLSRNMLTDNLMTSFFHGILNECISLKHLNLSYNQLTINSVKSFNECLSTRTSKSYFVIK